MIKRCFLKINSQWHVWLDYKIQRRRKKRDKREAREKTTVIRCDLEKGSLNVRVIN